MRRRSAPQVGLAAIDHLIELVDEAQARGEGGRPGLRDGQGGEQLAPGGPEQVGHRRRVAEGDEDGVDAVLQGRFGGAPGGAGTLPAPAPRAPRGRAARSPAPAPGGPARPAPRRRSCRSWPPGAPCPGPAGHRRSSTSQPASSSWSCTKRAPFIDSMAASRGSPCRAIRSTSVRSASASGATAVTSTVLPPSSSTCTSSRWRDRSNPAYTMVLSLQGVGSAENPTFSPRRPFFMTFSPADSGSATGHAG